MSHTTFDPKSIFDTYRTAFAPAVKAQQEGIKALDRVGRYQYDVAGDYLEWGLAQAKAALVAQTPADFVSKQVELTTALSEKLRARAQEFVALANDAQTSFVETAVASTKEGAKVAEAGAKVAAEAGAKVAAEAGNAAGVAASAAKAAASAPKPAAERFKAAADSAKAAAQTKKR